MTPVDGVFNSPCQGRYLRIRKEEEEEGDGEDFDDNASTITAATGASGGSGGGGGGGGGGRPTPTMSGLASSVASWRSDGGVHGSGSGRLAGGGGDGELKTLFGVDAEGTGTGDPEEIVYLVASARRHDRVR